jgi:hypothetical protein
MVSDTLSLACPSGDRLGATLTQSAMCCGKPARTVPHGSIPTRVVANTPPPARQVHERGVGADARYVQVKPQDVIGSQSLDQ